MLPKLSKLNKTLLAFFFILLISVIIYTMNDNDNKTLAIEKAKEVFAEHNPDLTQYKISVVENENSLVVIFLDKNNKINTIGNPGILPGFEVELNIKDLQVIKSHFIR